MPLSPAPIYFLSLLAPSSSHLSPTSVLWPQQPFLQPGLWSQLELPTLTLRLESAVRPTGRAKSRWSSGHSQCCAAFIAWAARFGRAGESRLTIGEVVSDVGGKGEGVAIINHLIKETKFTCIIRPVLCFHILDLVQPSFGFSSASFVFSRFGPLKKKHWTRLLLGKEQLLYALDRQDNSLGLACRIHWA